jgi:hypothetical protein
MNWKPPVDDGNQKKKERISRGSLFQVFDRICHQEQIPYNPMGGGGGGGV